MIQVNTYSSNSEVQCCYSSIRTTRNERFHPPGHFGGGKQHVAFEVKTSEYTDAKQKIKSKGITIIDEVVWKSGHESFYFEDPAGNILEIVPDEGIWD